MLRKNFWNVRSNFLLLNERYAFTACFTNKTYYDRIDGKGIREIHRFFFLIKQGEWDLQQVFPKKTSNVMNLFLNVFLALLAVKHIMENFEYWLFCICFYHLFNVNKLYY